MPGANGLGAVFVTSRQTEFDSRNLFGQNIFGGFWSVHACCETAQKGASRYDWSGIGPVRDHVVDMIPRVGRSRSVLSERQIYIKGVPAEAYCLTTQIHISCGSRFASSRSCFEHKPRGVIRTGFLELARVCVCGGQQCRHGFSGPAACRQTARVVGLASCCAAYSVSTLRRVPRR